MYSDNYDSPTIGVYHGPERTANAIQRTSHHSSRYSDQTSK